MVLCGVVCLVSVRVCCGDIRPSLQPQLFPSSSLASPPPLLFLSPRPPPTFPPPPAGLVFSLLFSPTATASQNAAALWGYLAGRQTLMYHIYAPPFSWQLSSRDPKTVNDSHQQEMSRGVKRSGVEWCGLVWSGVVWSGEMEWCMV